MQMSSSVRFCVTVAMAEGLPGVAAHRWGSTPCPCHPMGNSSCFGIPAIHKEFLLWQLQGEALAKGDSQLPTGTQVALMDQEGAVPGSATGSAITPGQWCGTQ